MTYEFQRSLCPLSLPGPNRSSSTKNTTRSAHPRKKLLFDPGVSMLPAPRDTVIRHIAPRPYRRKTLSRVHCHRTGVRVGVEVSFPDPRETPSNRVVTLREMFSLLIPGLSFHEEGEMKREEFTVSSQTSTTVCMALCDRRCYG